MPSAFLSAQELDRDAGILADMFTLLPPLPILFLAVFTAYQAVVNTIRPLSDQPVRYSLSIPFIR